MTNSYNIQRKHVMFNGDSSVIETSFCTSTAKEQLEIDFRIHKPCCELKLKKHGSFFLDAKSLIRRKHLYFNEDSSTTDRSPTPSTAKGLFSWDLGLSNPNYDTCACQRYNGKDNVQEEHMSFNEDGQASRGRPSQPSITEMSWTDSETCLPSHGGQLVEKHLLCTFGKNYIQRTHLYFNEDGSTTVKSPNTFTAAKLFEDDMKRSNTKLRQFTHPYENRQRIHCSSDEDGKTIDKVRHYWFDDEGKIIDKSSYPTSVIIPKTVIQDDFTSTCQNVDNVLPECSSLSFHQDFDNNRTDVSDQLPRLFFTNGQLTNDKYHVQSNFSDLSHDNSEALGQFTSLRVKEKDRESNTDVTSLSILQPETDLQVPNETGSKFVNEPASVQGDLDNCLMHFEDDFWSFRDISNITNLSSNPELLTAQDLPQSPRNDRRETKDATAEYSSDFLKLTFGRDANALFITDDEVVFEEEKRCPLVSCQMCVKLPHRHFKQHHPKLPKWKKDTCLALLDLSTAQDKTFRVSRCLFCNSMEINIKRHLCRVHQLPSNTKLYQEMENRCQTVFLSSTELLIETVFKAFKSYQRSKGFKKKSVNKQIMFIRGLLSSLYDDYIPEKLFVGRLLASNIYSLINILSAQRHSFNKLLHKQLMILRNFLEFLHFNSDIFSPVDKDWWEQVLPSWNVLELNENQLILVSCKI